MLQVGILAHKREGMQAFSCASGAGCALTRDHESRRGRKSPGGDWREAPFRPCEQARGRKGDSAPTLRVFPARRTRNPACGGTRKRPLRGLHEKDGPAPFHHKECGGGATAPNQGNCRGRASRGHDEPDATLKRASCAVGPVVRPSAAPRQIGKAASQHGKAGKAVREGGETRSGQRKEISRNFPSADSRIPNLVRRGEASGRGRRGGSRADRR